VGHPFPGGDGPFPWPKSQEGKLRCAQNPRKDGILGKEIVVKGGDGGESVSEFETFVMNARRR